MEIEHSSLAVMSALKDALDFLGEDSRRVVHYHMAERHGIRAGDRVSLPEVEAALASLLGPAAGIITVLVRKKLVGSSGSNSSSSATA
ncbi:hypothetical protein [Nitrososphaera viennensis]|nr:hypothetical protein [Nitrososphaera viennensis]UVS68091.1 hypothetical protein NWT39_09285 [Nitrososphaera viennensis]